MRSNVDFVWRKFSKSGEVVEVVREAPEGIPAYLMGPVTEWLSQAFLRPYDDGLYRGTESRRSVLRDLQLHGRLDPPLCRNDGTSEALDLLGRVSEDEEFALSVVDYVLRNIQTTAPDPYRWPDYVEQLEVLLSRGGSVWQVVASDDGNAAQLARREAGPIREAILELPASSRGHLHLVRSWNRMKAREPDNPSAYREAIRAVEAVAKPVISPSNPRATLGTMLRDMRTKPAKWMTTIGSMKEIELMMASVWTAQLDRHGTDDESVPLDVSAEETDAAFSVCLALVRLFVANHVVLVDG